MSETPISPEENKEISSSDHNSVAGQSVENNEPAGTESVEPKKNERNFGNFLKERLLSFFRGIIARQVIQKVFSLIFALVVFSFAYMQMLSHRSILTYMGVMLLMVLVYAEILVIRDHLWVIEGSMRESRRWRDVFFNQTSMRRQRLRKFLILIFSMAIFSYIIVKSSGKLDPVLTFMGLILMITVLYYEVLNIRDEVWIMMQSISTEKKEEEENPRKEEYNKFLEEKSSDKEELKKSEETTEPSIEKDKPAEKNDKNS